MIESRAAARPSTSPTPSAAQFERCRPACATLGVDFELAPRLVRGFDYYTATTFEFQSDAIDGAQNAIGGGGRYDRLAEEMGGPPDAGDRLRHRASSASCSRCEARACAGAARRALDVFVVDGLDTGDATTLSHELRRGAARPTGFAVDRADGGRSVKEQWKRGRQVGRALAVMVGRDELARDAVAVKDLASGEQVEVRARRGLVAVAGRPQRRSSTRARPSERPSMMRTHGPGELRAGDIGDRRSRSAAGSRTVATTAGSSFLDLRDATGIVQVVVDPSEAGLDDVQPRRRASGCCRSRGAVRPRPEGTVNDRAAHR